MTYQLYKNPTRRSSHMLEDIDNLLHPQRIPATNIIEREEGYTMELEVPGYERDEVNISVENGILSISSIHEESTSEEKELDLTEGTYLLKERRRKSFSRSFVLPKDSSVEDIEGSIKQGILFVWIPKREETKPRSIEIRED